MIHRNVLKKAQIFKEISTLNFRLYSQPTHSFVHSSFIHSAEVHSFIPQQIFLGYLLCVKELF